MTTGGFCGPLASEFAGFAATLEASASANKTTLTQLRALDRFTRQHGLPSGTIDETLARAWLAGCESRGPNTRRARYYLLRRFCRHLSRRRPDTFVPGESLRPRGRPPKRPRIYSREEIRRLLDGALTLRDWTRGHPCPIRSKTMRTIILLLVTSGLRISEALHLSLQDVDLAAGVLSIRQSKFRKSRLVPVSAGTLEELRRYHDLRLTVAPADPGGAFFVSGRGTAYSPSTVQAMFRDLTIQSGLRGPHGRGPRLHDLRATFAVTRLLQWYRDGEDVMARLPLLSTYLGHASVTDTEVYLAKPSEIASAGRETAGHQVSPCAGIGSGARRHRPADLRRPPGAPVGYMIRPSEGCRPPRGGTLSRGPCSGRAGRPEGCPIASKRTGPLLPPRCGLGIRTVLIPDSAIFTAALLQEASTRFRDFTQDLLPAPGGQP